MLILIVCAAWVLLSVVLATGFSLLKTGQARAAAASDAGVSSSAPARRRAIAA